MELTDDIIDMAYKFAHTFLKRYGRHDIDHRDLAHDAMVKLAMAAPVPAAFLRRRVWLDVKSVFYEFYTNTTTRKHNVMLDAVHAEFEMETRDPDTVEAVDLFGYAFRMLYEGQPTQAEILMLIVQGKTVQEIASMRGTSVQAVDHLKQKAKRELAAVLTMAA